MLPLQAQQWNLPLFTSSASSVLSAANQAVYPEGANAVVLSYAVEIRVAADGRMERTARTVARILRVQGVSDFQTLSTSWNTTREERPRLRARVITRDGQAHVLEDSRIHERYVTTAVEGVNSATKIIYANLNEADVDSVVETEIDSRDQQPGLIPGRFGRLTIPSKFPILSLTISVSAPAETPLRLQVRSIPGAKRAESIQSGTRQISIEASKVMPPSEVILVPPEIALQPTVEFSTTPNWQTAGAAYAAAVAKILPASVEARGKGSDPLDSIAEAVGQVHKEVKFSGLRWGFERYVPASIDEIVKAGVGDSADEAILLVAELRKRGIQAFPAFLRPEPAPDVLPELPGLEAFESVVVYVPGSKPVWIDPSAESVPVSCLPAVDQGRWALIADGGTTALTKTLEESAESNGSIDTMTIRLQDGPKPSVIREVRTRGAMDESLRPMIATLKSKSKESAGNQISKLGAIEKVQSYESSNNEDLRHPSYVKIVGQGYTSSQVTDDGGYIEVAGPTGLNFGKFAAMLRLATYAPDRVHTRLPPRGFGYYTGPPFTEELRYRVIPPPGYRFKQPDAPPHVDLGPLRLTTSVKLEPDGSVSVSHILVDPKPRYSPGEATSICDGMVKLIDQKTFGLTLINIGEEEISNGQFREGLLTLRKNAAADPANPMPTLRLATAYINAGSRPDAEKICKEAIAKGPKNTEAYGRLGWVYTHDEFGRAFEPGMDYAGAEAAFRQALAIEPGSKVFTLRLATLYSHNPAGIVCGPGARLADALSEFNRAGLGYLASVNAVNDYALTLLCAKRFDELRNLFLYKEAERADPTLKIAAIAGSDGIAAATQELDLSAPANAKNIALIGAARMLLTAREYKTAISLMEAAGEKTAASQPGFARLRRTSEWNGASGSDAAPVLAVKRFIAAVVDSGNPESWRKTVVPQWTAFDPNRSRRVLLKLLEPDQAALTELPGWLNIAGDELTTSFSFSASGGDQAGYQVFIADSAGKPRQIARVVKRGADYLVSSLDLEGRPTLFDSAPAEIKSLVQRGQLREAFESEEKRCADSHSEAIDWILQARLGLLMGGEEQAVKDAAEHAMELTHGDNGDAIENVALAQIEAGEFKEALLNGRKLADGWGTHDEAAVVFGGLAEALDLPLGASQFYGEVKRPDTGAELSPYALAQKRLAVSGTKH